MEFSELVAKNRSYRRFYQERRIAGETLAGLVNAARLTASARNMQPLKYVTVTGAETCARIFETLAWAGYLTDWDGPSEGERPAAYIVMCNDARLAAESRWDQGIAAQTILLGAVEAGLGGCIVGAFRKEEASRILELPQYLTPVLVLALGVPKENVTIVEPASGDIRYYRKPDGTHCVPKRPLEEVLIGEKSV